MPKNWVLILAVSALLLLGVYMIFFASRVNFFDKYPLLAKRLSVEQPDDILVNFAPLRQDIHAYLDKIGVKNSLYFEYLYTGTSIRVGDNEEQVAASLMKIPLVMSLYKASELKLIDLNQEVVISQPEISNEFGDLWQKGPGTKISLQEAARLTLIDSDNTAANVIFDNIKNLQTTNNIDALKEIDVDMTTTADKRVTISARSYASILKCLYLACYLSKDHSQELLSLLTESTLDNGLLSGVPSNVPVANKIGTFSNINESDCGIVYVPLRAYLLCVMLELPNDQAKTHIRALSKMVYDYVVNDKNAP